MKHRLHIIYIPGIGDHKIAGQQMALRLWRLYGVNVEIIQMNWIVKEPWDTKFQKILQRVDELHEADYPVALVGVSAGASAALNAYAARKDKISGVACISGKIQRPETIGQHYRQEDPAFLTSAKECQTALKKLNAQGRAHILCRYGRADNIVDPADSRIDGAHNQQAPTVNHGLNIAFQIIFGAPSIVRFLKKQVRLEK